MVLALATGCCKNLEKRSTVHTHVLARGGVCHSSHSHSEDIDLEKNKLVVVRGADVAGGLYPGGCRSRLPQHSRGACGRGDRPALHCRDGSAVLAATHPATGSQLSNVYSSGLPTLSVLPDAPQVGNGELEVERVFSA